VVHQVDRTVMIFKLTPGGEYGKPEIYSVEDTVTVGIFPGLAIELNTIFQDLAEEG
jgi:hypothetical protein